MTVPLMIISRCRDSQDLAVFEMQSNRPREMAWVQLGRIYALINVKGGTCLDFFGDSNHSTTFDTGCVLIHILFHMTDVSQLLVHRWASVARMVYSRRPMHGEHPYKLRPIRARIPWTLTRIKLKAQVDGDHSDVSTKI